MTRRPVVFDLDEVDFDDAPAGAPDAAAQAPEAAPPPRPSRRRRGIRPEPVAAPEATGPAPTPAPLKRRRRRRVSWSGMFGAGVAGLSALALTISLTAFVEDMLARAPALGGLAALFAALMVVGLAGVALREWFAIRHLKEVEALRRRADAAVASDDSAAARRVLADLAELYTDRPATARGRAALKGHMREVIDGRDLIALAEREVLAALDREAIGHVVSASRRVAAVTALSPRALVDVGYVVFAALVMVRRVAMTYGGRPGTLGFLRVLRHAVAHLAVTGGMAAGDSLIGEVIGKGIAAKLSAKLGEGIVNGLMTARLGLAALDVLRPLPFHGTRRPRVNDILSEIARIAPGEERVEQP
ncbi:YcjF family protein [Acuticoccus sp.]|uniref:YcjF family protein n=1 Tax=Acuticoccus sp. TaxID=1904378 RepID=UPI003B51FF18